jgi:beta-xylosidase
LGLSIYQRIGRETFLYPVTWEDGWPIFNNNEPVSEHIEGVLEDTVHAVPFFDDFKKAKHDTLGLSYLFQRTPLKKFYSLKARPGYLRIKGNAYRLGDRDNPAVVLRKQAAYNETLETELEFTPTSNLTEAGITAFANDLNHGEIGIALINGTKSVVTRYLQPRAQVGPWGLILSNITEAIVSALYYSQQRINLIGCTRLHTPLLKPMAL